MQKAPAKGQKIFSKRQCPPYFLRKIPAWWGRGAGKPTVRVVFRRKRPFLWKSGTAPTTGGRGRFSPSFSYTNIIGGILSKKGSKKAPIPGGFPLRRNHGALFPQRKQETFSACWTSRTWCWPCQASGNFFAFHLIFGLILRFFRTSDSNFILMHDARKVGFAPYVCLAYCCPGRRRTTVGKETWLLFLESPQFLKQANYINQPDSLYTIRLIFIRHLNG